MKHRLKRIKKDTLLMDIKPTYQISKHLIMDLTKPEFQREIEKIKIDIETKGSYK